MGPRFWLRSDGERRMAGIPMRFLKSSTTSRPPIVGRNGYHISIRVKIILKVGTNRLRELGPPSQLKQPGRERTCRCLAAVKV